MAVLLYFGARDDVLDHSGRTPKDEAKGEVIAIFELYARKGKGALLAKYPKLFSFLNNSPRRGFIYYFLISHINLSLSLPEAFPKKQIFLYYT